VPPVRLPRAASTFDLLSGIGVASLGHGAPGHRPRDCRPGAAAAAYVETSSFIRCKDRFAEKLVGDVRPAAARFFLQTAGPRAVEAWPEVRPSLLVTRREEPAPPSSSRSRNPSTDGRSEALSVTFPTSTTTARRSSPCFPGSVFVPVNDPAALKAAVFRKKPPRSSAEACARGRRRPAAHSCVCKPAINEACAATAALLIADEVQSGPLGVQARRSISVSWGLKPHLVSLGKALGGGVPIGGRAHQLTRVAKTISYGDHGSTYGGNLLACRACALLPERTDRRRRPQNVRRVGRFLRRTAARPGGQATRSSRTCRGVGLIWGPRTHAPTPSPVVQAGPRERRESSTGRRKPWCGCCRR